MRESPPIESPVRTPLEPGSTLGVLGGGQLGRMFAQAAQAMGYQVVVLEPQEQSPAGQVCEHRIVCAYDDARGLASLARACAAITTEFENVPAQALTALARLRRVAPPAAAVAISQDRAAEKRHFQHNGIAVAPFAIIDSEQSLADAPAQLFPGILKTSRMGYDGKGQVTVANPGELAAAWQALDRRCCVLERHVDLDFECSVILARGSDGTMVHLPVQRNIHRNGILATTLALPGSIRPEIEHKAIQTARRIAASTGYVGVLCVEFFVLGDGSVITNEMAPRPHNSGHYSMNACDISQFELQVRTLAGLPLAAPRQHSPAIMLNVLGDLYFRSGSTTAQSPDWAQLLALKGVHLHLYGKAHPRPGRKMGHITVTAASNEAALETAAKVADLLGLPRDFGMPGNNRHPFLSSPSQ